ncbi:MAG: DUF3343 domain-containing protein [Deltaproteobacteria bacterium]|nr:DUF3343 domain-containing protein [Deltaproteobacteria bacterium]
MELLLGFGSAHGALKAEDILNKAGVSFRLVTAPKTIDPACGLLVEVSEINLQATLDALKNAAFEPKAIYRKDREP